MKTPSDIIPRWKSKLVGWAFIFSATAYVANANWPSMWTWPHIRAGLVGLLLICVGVGLLRGWGFRNANA